MPDFLDIADHDTATLKAIIADALVLKADASAYTQILCDKAVALIFEKPSTRTRVSFEAGINALGGAAIVLRSEDTQLGRGETIADTAKVLSRYVDALMIRTTGHDILHELAENASIPVINGLTDKSHPCQVMADVMTLAERKAPDQDYSALKVAWFGDGNNVACSWIEAAAAFGFTLYLAMPPSFAPDEAIVKAALAKGGKIIITSDVNEAAADADCVVTDTWASMGAGGGEQANSNSGETEALLRPYQVNDAIMNMAKREAIFMHCLPVYRGHEVTADIVDGAQSVIWDEAENRLHVQKSIMAWCLDIKLH